MDLQSRTNAALDNYLRLLDILMSDGFMLPEMQQADVRWQRIFIRSAVALVEGYNYCFSEIAAIGLECNAPEIGKKEREALLAKERMETGEQIKLVLRASYRMFGLSPVPESSSEHWQNAKLALGKRRVLMHPKTPDCEPRKLWRAIKKPVIQPDLQDATLGLVAAPLHDLPHGFVKLVFKGTDDLHRRGNVSCFTVGQINTRSLGLLGSLRSQTLDKLAHLHSYRFVILVKRFIDEEILYGICGRTDVAHPIEHA
jgi:hypothetical protein